ncbi:MAG: carboxylesterase/lipase family protein [Bacteroidales bacterium]|nr:carboxylesterase/lipase family protein [Bacteroidales bacterium]
MKKSFQLLLMATAALFSACNGGSGNGTTDLGYDPDAQQLQIGEDIAVVRTTYGTVKGFIYQNVNTFLGIPYGDDTGGENRFMPPKPPKPWEGVLPTVWYPTSAPQRPYTEGATPYAQFRDRWNYDGFGEDCLKLNVWTPGLDASKRPVLVWLHGGGFAAGNGVEQDGYMGGNFARRHDVVFVSLNHRLNSFGFSDFAAVGGEKYKHSGNVGMLDIIFALQWVHDNIAAFGGDPGNVTIVGQSGGGSKVTIAAAMPAAKGLVHKAFAMSGGSTAAADKAYAEGLGAQILKTAGLKPSQIDQLQQMPWPEYFALANRAASEYNAALPAGQRYRGFSPVADGIDIPVGDFYTSGRDDVPCVPMILSTTTNEFVSDRDTPEQEKLSREDIVKMLEPRYGENAGAIYDEFDRIFPGNSPFGVYSIVSSSRQNVIRLADNKLAQGQPVYLAWFNWYPHIFDGLPRAFHCLDISFWFNNTDLMYSHTGGGKEPRVLADKMGDALEAFMRTGDPNTGQKDGLPFWPRYTREDGATMILNNVSRVENDPDRQARALMQ